MTGGSNFLSQGVREMLLSTLAFSLANLFVKKVSHIPAMEIVFFRCLVGAAFCYIGFKRASADPIGSNRISLLMRGLFGTTALYLFFLTVQNIPLASAMTIQYLSPIFTTIIAIFLLSESVRPLQWLFYAIAFTGVLLIHQVDTRVSLAYLVIGVTSAFCSGVAYNLVRSLRGREHPLTVVFHFQIVGMILGLVFTLFNWESPQGADWVFIFLVGVFSQLGQIFLTNALQKERAASVAIVNYTGLIYGAIFGWFVFAEPQPPASAAGMLLVVLGVFLSILYKRRKDALDELESTAA